MRKLSAAAAAASTHYSLVLVVLVVVDCRSRVCAEVVVVWNDGGGTVNNSIQTQFRSYLILAALAWSGPQSKAG